MLRATLEAGTTPDLERRIRSAKVLVTSRLSLVESARALLRVRLERRVSEARIAKAEQDLGSLWRHCEIWEVSPAIADLASGVAPGTPLRTLDALHLATFLMARRRIEGLSLVTADDRLRAAADALR